MRAKGVWWIGLGSAFLLSGCGDDTNSQTKTAQAQTIAPASIVQNDLTLHEAAGGISTLRLDLANQFTLTRSGAATINGNYSNPIQNGNSFTTTLASGADQESLMLSFASAQTGSFTLTPTGTNAITGNFTMTPIITNEGGGEVITAVSGKP